MGIILFLNPLKYFAEIIERHVGMKGRDLAVAAAVTAFEVAAEGGFPEKLPQGMLFLHLPYKLPVQFKCYFLSDCKHVASNVISSTYLPLYQVPSASPTNFNGTI